MIGLNLSHYRIEAELGRGGMAVVYRAFDTELDRTVALKLLPLSAVSSSDDHLRFIREAKAAASLHHANIATVFGIDEAVPEGAGSGSEPRHFIAMEYIEGETLRTRLDRGALAFDEAVSIATQIASALEAAHGKDIVHRDIKSANVMLTPDGTAKVLDFGLAKSSSSTMLTKMGSTLGTVAYMSPEQARGEDVDTRTDLYSLGIVIYEMISGRRPFLGDYDAAVLYSLLNEEPPPLGATMDQVPAGLQSFMDKALSKDRGKRFQSASDLVAGLRGTGIAPHSAGAGEGRFKGQRKAWAIWSGLALLSLVAVLLLTRTTGDDGADRAEEFHLVVAPFWSPTQAGADEGRVIQTLTERHIRAELDTEPGVRVTGREVLERPESFDEARDLGRRLSASLVLWGEVISIGGDVEYQPYVTYAEAEGSVSRVRQAAVALAGQGSESQVELRTDTAEDIARRVITEVLLRTRRDELDAKLAIAVAAGDIAETRRLIGANRLALKPIVFQLMTEAIQLELEGEQDQSAERILLAKSLAINFEELFGERSLSSATSSYDSWTRAEKRTKLFADSLNAVATEIRGDDKERARELLQNALIAYQGIGDNNGVAGALGGLNYVSWYLDRSAYLTAALRALEARIAVDDRQLMGNSYSDIGLGYRVIERDYEAALNSYSKSERIRWEIGDSTGLARMLPSLGVIMEGAGDLAQAASYFGRAGSLFLALGDSSTAVLQFWNAGRIQSEDPAASLLSLTKGLEVARGMEDRRTEVMLLTSIAGVHIHFGRHDEAASNYLRAIRIATMGAWPSLEASAQMGAGTSYREMGRLDSSAIALDRALVLYSNEADTSGVIQASLQKAETQVAQGDIQGAQDLIRRALGMAELLESVDLKMEAQDLLRRVETGN